MFKRSMLSSLVLLLLAGCDDMPRARTESDIEAIATDAATDATSGKFSELEDRIDDLESKVKDLETELAGARAYSRSVAGTVDSNADALGNLGDAYKAHTHQPQ
jgi:outer membrane murein-binding lipoprotein Lpp